jgi:hypothetical protein
VPYSRRCEGLTWVCFTLNIKTRSLLKREESSMQREAERGNKSWVWSFSALNTLAVRPGPVRSGLVCPGTGVCRGRGQKVGAPGDLAMDMAAGNPR